MCAHLVAHNKIKKITVKLLRKTQNKLTILSANAIQTNQENHLPKLCQLQMATDNHQICQIDANFPAQQQAVDCCQYKQPNLLFAATTTTARSNFCAKLS